jgi:hypothetical protein
MEIKPYEQLNEVEKYCYTITDGIVIKREMTEIQYYRIELEQMKNEIYNSIIKFLQVDEGEKYESEWTKEEYQCVLEKYKEKVNQVNELLEKLNK